MTLDGSFDQYLRIVAYNLAILFLLMLSMNVNGVKYVLRAMAILLAVQQISVWMRLLGRPDMVLWVQAYPLTIALWILVVTLGLTMLAIGRVRH